MIQLQKFHLDLPWAWPFWSFPVTQSGGAVRSWSWRFLQTQHTRWNVLPLSACTWLSSATIALLRACNSFAHFSTHREEKPHDFPVFTQKKDERHPAFMFFSWSFKQVTQSCADKCTHTQFSALVRAWVLWIQSKLHSFGWVAGNSRKQGLLGAFTLRICCTI